VKELKLSIEQIQTATELYNIRENDSVGDTQAKIAHDLYISLKDRKPNLFEGPDIVKPIKINNVPQKMEPEFFKQPERIMYLTRWIINILPFLDLLSSVGKLPLTRLDDDFEGFINDTLTNYLNEVREIYDNIPTQYNLIKEDNFYNLTEIVREIKRSINEYLKGYPSNAFTKLEEGIDTQLLHNGYLNHIMTLKDKSLNRLYKMRIGTNHTYSSTEMFHIPLQLRGLVSTNRYSIPGVPCVYLGSSPLTCWEELNKPDLNTVQTSLFVTKNISYLNLSTPPAAIIDNLELMYQQNGTSDAVMKTIYKELKSYIIVWPLLAACSIRVKNITHTFKPEYIIPQLLLQWIRRSKQFDGICYFSTKVNNYTMNTAELYINFAFPIQEQKKRGYCSILRNKFTITDAVPWQMFQFYKNTQFARSNEEAIQAELEFVEGMKLPYIATDFNRLESLLINKLENNIELNAR
jgi:hypothetical protein